MTRTLRECRSGDRCQPVTLREALHCQVHHSACRSEEIARHLGMQPGSLSDAVNPHHDSPILAARHYERVLELTVDNLAVVTYLADRQGAVVHRGSRTSRRRERRA